MPKSKTAIAELRQQAEANLAGWQRALADLENFQKRALEEKEGSRQRCLQDVIDQILPVLDNFQLACDHIPESEKTSGWVAGIMHIQKQLTEVLRQNGVKEIEIKIGDEFNPNLMEAIESVESPEVKSGQVIRLVQAGYWLNGKVMRHAKVVVAR